MTKHETVENAEFFARSTSLNLETVTRGRAICWNPQCEHRTGTDQGKPRTDRIFDYTSAIVHRLVETNRRTYCTDAACQRMRERENAQLRKEKKKAAQQKLAPTIATN